MDAVAHCVRVLRMCTNKVLGCPSLVHSNYKYLRGRMCSVALTGTRNKRELTNPSHDVRFGREGVIGSEKRQSITLMFAGFGVMSDVRVCRMFSSRTHVVPVASK